MTSVVVDTDTGIDDALTLVYLAAVGGVDLVACTATHGNCSTADSAINVGHVLALCGLPGVPIHLGRQGHALMHDPTHDFERLVGERDPAIRVVVPAVGERVAP